MECKIRQERMEKDSRLEVCKEPRVMDKHPFPTC
jgi:hypothetical protein